MCDLTDFSLAKLPGSIPDLVAFHKRFVVTTAQAVSCSFFYSLPERCSIAFFGFHRLLPFAPHVEPPLESSGVEVGAYRPLLLLPF